MDTIQPHEEPPTLIRTNKFTVAFQILIDAYGVANYREVNPALYTIVTFPFLFAMMFGDCGHGFIMTLAALYMVIWEEKLIAKKIDNEMWTMVFAGRYIILLMGLFSIYTGLLYNDLFSFSINLFGSSWFGTEDVIELDDKKITLDPSYNYTQQPYFMGLDPVWQVRKLLIKN